MMRLTDTDHSVRGKILMHGTGVWGKRMVTAALNDRHSFSNSAVFVIVIGSCILMTDFIQQNFTFSHSKFRSFFLISDLDSTLQSEEKILSR